VAGALFCNHATYDDDTTLHATSARHRRIAISLLAPTLNSAAAFSIAVASSAASTVPSRTALAAIL
jgi:hypothetical protein